MASVSVERRLVPTKTSSHDDRFLLDTMANNELILDEAHLRHVFKVGSASNIPSKQLICVENLHLYLLPRLRQVKDERVYEFVLMFMENEWTYETALTADDERESETWKGIVATLKNHKTAARDLAKLLLRFMADEDSQTTADFFQGIVDLLHKHEYQVSGFDRYVDFDMKVLYSDPDTEEAKLFRLIRSFGQQPLDLPLFQFSKDVSDGEFVPLLLHVDSLDYLDNIAVANIICLTSRLAYECVTDKYGPSALFDRVVMPENGFAKEDRPWLMNVIAYRSNPAFYFACTEYVTFNKTAFEIEITRFLDDVDMAKRYVTWCYNNMAPGSINLAMKTFLEMKSPEVSSLIVTEMCNYQASNHSNLNDIRNMASQMEGKGFQQLVEAGFTSSRLPATGKAEATTGTTHSSISCEMPAAAATAGCC